MTSDPCQHEILDPEALLAAAALGAHHERLDPATEAQVARALETRSRSALLAAWLTLHGVYLRAREGGAAVSAPRLHALAVEVDAALHGPRKPRRRKRRRSTLLSGAF